MQARRKIAVAGATGNVGRYVVDVLKNEGHDVVGMSRSGGVDVVSGDGLAEALEGVEYVIDVATQPSPDQPGLMQRHMNRGGRIWAYRTSGEGGL